MKNIWKIEDKAKLLKALKIALTKEDLTHGCDGCRTCRGQAALVAPSVQSFVRLGGEDCLKDALTDMLADMMLLVDLANDTAPDDERIAFEELIDRAENHHRAEILGEKETREYLRQQPKPKMVKITYRGFHDKP
jgi:hypothetical protein